MLPQPPLLVKSHRYLLWTKGMEEVFQERRGGITSGESGVNEYRYDVSMGVAFVLVREADEQTMTPGGKEGRDAENKDDDEGNKSVEKEVDQ